MLFHYFLWSLHTSELLLKKYVSTTENILANTTEAHISMRTNKKNSTMLTLL